MGSESGKGALPRPTELAHRLLGAVVREGDRVVDATAGNGYDTVFLAERVGSGGEVIAFDVQEEAIVSAKKRVELAGFGDRVKFFTESHEEIGRRVPADSASVVMFNLGYFPGGDHERITTLQGTLAGLEAAAVVLKAGGWLSVVVYPGHPGGAEEAAAVEDWMERRAAAGWRVVRYGALGTLRAAPVLLLGVKPSPGRSVAAE